MCTKCGYGERCRWETSASKRNPSKMGKRPPANRLYLHQPNKMAQPLRFRLKLQLRLLLRRPHWPRKKRKADWCKRVKRIPNTTLWWVKAALNSRISVIVKHILLAANSRFTHSDRLGCGECDKIFKGKVSPERTLCAYATKTKGPCDDGNGKSSSGAASSVASRNSTGRFKSSEAVPDF